MTKTTDMSDKLAVRRVNDADIAEIFKLSNQPSVRRASFRNAPIPWPEHVQWFNAMMENPQCGFFVAAVDGRIAGQIRFTREGTQATVSISIDPRFRRMGIGAILYSKGLTAFRLQQPIMTIVAKARKHNIQSVAFFKALGFVFSSVELINGVEGIVMVSHLDYPEVEK